MLTRNRLRAAVQVPLDSLSFSKRTPSSEAYATATSYQPVLDRLGVTKAKDLLDLRNGSKVLVAGIRVATQTPPMRGGKRVVFISVDDGTGCVDATFFSDAQEKVAPPILFSTNLLLIEGTTRRTGPRGMSLQASNAWDLAALTLPGAATAS